MGMGMSEHRALPKCLRKSFSVDLGVTGLGEIRVSQTGIVLNLCSISLYSKSVNFSILVNYGQIAALSWHIIMRLGFWFIPVIKNPIVSFQVKEPVSNKQYHGFVHIISISNKHSNKPYQIEQPFCYYQYITNFFVHIFGDLSVILSVFISLHLPSSHFGPGLHPHDGLNEVVNLLRKIRDLMAWWDLTF